MRLSVVVPAYNEEARIAGLLELLKKSLSDLGDEYELIVVDDGSSDGTRHQVAGDRVQLFVHEQNRGKAAAVQKIADSLISTKGVKHGRLTLTTSGAELK